MSTATERSIEHRDNAWWIVEHRPGVAANLAGLYPDQCVAWGDGETYHRLLTRTNATTEAEALAILNDPAATPIPENR